jgi:hypothetical protein
LALTKTGRIKLLAFAIGLIFAILFAEIAGRILRLLPKRSSEAYAKLTQEVGRLPTPFSRTRFSEPGEFDISLQFNAMGFRDQQIDFPESAKGKRILAVGDSFVTAWEVELNQRWTEQMHRFRSDWSILNVGMRNWGIDQTYLNLVNYPLKKDPDTVLLMFFVGNDVSDNYRPGIIKTEWDAPNFVPVNEGSTVNDFKDLRKVPWSGYVDPFDEPKRMSFPRNFNAWLRLHSVVYRAIDLTRQFIQKKATKNSMESEVKNAAEPPATWGVFRLGEDPPEWETAWQITEVLLREMKVESDKRGTQFIMVIAPYSPLIEPNDQVKRKGLLDRSKYDLEKPSKRLIEFAQQNGIPIFDLAPGLIRFRGENPNKKLFFPNDGHFTVLGNCVVAAEIVSWMDSTSKADPNQCL